jgi:flagellar basal-body rod protein FlgB
MGILSKVLFDPTPIPLLKRSLDASSLRQKVIANNLANVSTPAYNRREVTFEDELRKAINRNGIQGRTTHRRHIPIGRQSVDRVQPKIVEVTDQADFNGVNNVDVDQEMAALAKNQILFNAAAKLAADKFRGLRKAILGRSG